MFSIRRSGSDVGEEQLQHPLVAQLVHLLLVGCEPAAQRARPGVGQLVDRPRAAARRLRAPAHEPLILEPLELGVDLPVARGPEVAGRLVDELLDVVAGRACRAPASRGSPRPVGVRSLRSGVGAGSGVAIHRQDISVRGMCQEGRVVWGSMSGVAGAGGGRWAGWGSAAWFAWRVGGRRRLSRRPGLSAQTRAPRPDRGSKVRAGREFWTSSHARRRICDVFLPWPGAPPPATWSAPDAAVPGGAQCDLPRAGRPAPRRCSGHDLETPHRGREHARPSLLGAT